MRLVHLADLHLGFRQYQRLTAGGLNQREADVGATVERAIEQVIARAPDVVVVGGDVFHTVRPSNPTILQAYRVFSRLRSALPETPVVVVAGNHDAPRTADAGCLLTLFREIGVHVADSTADLFTFPDRGLAVLAVPDVPGIVRPPLVPPDGFAYRVLLLHGEVAGLLPAHVASAERATVEIPAEALHAEQWSYVALGHYHVCREVAPRAWYSGSLDYTSTNPWGELREEQSLGLPGKGFLEFDLATGERRFHPVAPARPLLELEPIDAAGMTAADVDRALRARVEAVPGGLEERIVRVLVREAPRHVVRALDHAALREYRRQAMHFQLDTRAPDPAATRRGRGGGSGMPGVRRTLADLLTAQVHSRPLAADLDRERLLELGLHYLREAEDAALAALPAVEG